MAEEHETTDWVLRAAAVLGAGFAGWWAKRRIPKAHAEDRLDERVEEAVAAKLQSIKDELANRQAARNAALEARMLAAETRLEQHDVDAREIKRTIRELGQDLRSMLREERETTQEKLDELLAIIRGRRDHQPEAR